MDLLSRASVRLYGVAFCFLLLLLETGWKPVVDQFKVIQRSAVAKAFFFIFVGLLASADEEPIHAFNLANLASWLCMVAGTCHFFVVCCCSKLVDSALKANRKAYLLKVSYP